MERTRKLYYSDNLTILRDLESESIDLIYLDPPFNSDKAYNIIYPNDLGQVMAFEDTWYWSPQCDEYMEELSRMKNATAVYDVLNALVSALGKVQMCAYLVNMAVRIVEFPRTLKRTGSLYLHCNSTASHYLKIVLDAVFVGENFVNEIVWNYGTPSGGRASGEEAGQS